MSSRVLALAHLTVIELGPEELVDAAAEAGFDGVTLRLVARTPGEAAAPLVNDARRRAAVIRRLRDRGLVVLDVEAFHLTGTTDLDAASPLLEAAAELGARHLLVVGDEPDHTALAAALRGLCERCAPLGLRAALEFIPFTATASLADAVAVVRAADHPAACVLVDPLHLRRSGGAPADVAAIAATEPGLFPYSQWCDAAAEAPPGGDRGLYREAVGARLLPGDGELPLRDLLVALPAGIPLAVEAPTAALAADGAVDRAARVCASTRAWLADADIGIA